MAWNLEQAVAPGTTALLSMEMQRGVVGDLSAIAPLVEAAAEVGLAANLGRLVDGARASGVQVVFCNAVHRPDRKGSAANCPMLARSARLGGMVEGTPEVELVKGLGPRPQDIVSWRYHGMSPFTGTSLDVTLRNLGVRTIVATGVSLNVGLIAMCAEAVGLGYQVVVPRDCVVGVPVAYGAEVLRHSIPVLATVVDSAELLSAWQQ